MEGLLRLTLVYMKEKKDEAVNNILTLSACVLSASSFIIDCRNEGLDRDYLMRQATFLILAALYLQGGVNG